MFLSGVASEDGKKSARINEEELEPVRDQPDVATADTIGHQHVDQPDTGGGHQRQVPKALHMRFQAELHQMESIEEAERQLNQLNRLRDVATARNEAVTAANYVQVQCTLQNFTIYQRPDHYTYQVSVYLPSISILIIIHSILIFKY